MELWSSPGTRRSCHASARLVASLITLTGPAGMTIAIGEREMLEHVIGD